MTGVIIKHVAVCVKGFRSFFLFFGTSKVNEGIEKDKSRIDLAQKVQHTKKALSDK